MSCSCGCSTPSECTCHNPCCTPASSCNPAYEPFARTLQNFITNFFGEITKVCNDDGEVDWELPCNLGADEPIPGYPRLDNEGIACYLLRVFPIYFADLVAAGITPYVNTVNALKVRALHGFIEVPTNKTYVLMAAAELASVINNIRIGTLSGTCTAAIQINGVAVTGLGAIAVTSVEQTVNATALNTLAVNDKVTMVITNNVAAADLEFSLKYTSSI